MAFQSVPATAEVVVRTLINEVILTNTYYGLRVGGYTVGDLTNLATAIDGWAAVSWRSILSSEAFYVETVVRGLENENDFEVTVNTSAGVGAVASPPTSVNNALCIARRSAYTGRSARGRVYYPFTAQDVSSANENFVTSSFFTAAQAVANAIGAYFTANGWIEVIVSRYFEKAKRPVGVTFNVIEYAATDSRIDSQRGRLP